MELRRCSQFHFITAIRNGEVVKVLNVNRGKPSLKFKSITEIYESGGSRYQDSQAKLPSKVRRSVDMRGGCDTVKVEPVEVRDFSDDKRGCSFVHHKRNNDLDDLEFANVTLKQLQQKCKYRKRKAPVTESNVETCQVVEQDCSEKPDDDEFGSRETLSSWTFKLAKRSKAKKKCSSNSDSMSTETDAMVVKSEPVLTDEDLQNIKEEINAPRSIEDQDSQPDSFECRTINCPFGADEGALSGKLERDVSMSTLGDSQSIDFFQIAEDHLEQPTVSVIPELNQVSHELIDQANTETSKLEDAVRFNVISIAGSCELEQVLYEHLDQAKDSSVVSESSEPEEIEPVGDTPIADDQSVVLPASLWGKEEDKGGALTCEEPLETFFLSPQSSYDSCENAPQYSFLEGNLKTEIHVEVVHDGEAPLPDNSEDHLPPCDHIVDCPIENYDSILNSNQCWKPVSNVISLVNNGCNSEERRFLTCIIDNAPQMCNDQPTKACGSPDGIAIAEASESHEDLKPEKPPVRLFSSRKDISPTSQEKLRRATNPIELQGNTETQIRSKKLCFEKACDKKASHPRSDERGEATTIYSIRDGALDTSDITSKHRQSSRKRKDNLRCTKPKYIIRGPHPSQLLQVSGKDCSPIQSCSQNAIAFSQQQMHDIERLAIKLMTELQSMKDIVVDNLQSETRMGTKLRYTTNEVRKAVESAAKVEETTKKWLSMMTRDCNRFQKNHGISGKRCCLS